MYFWEGMLGFFAMPLPILFALTFLVLAFQVLRQLVWSIKERLRDKQRLGKITIVMVLLTLIVLRPFGIINYSAFESKNIFVAKSEGAANCTTTLILKESGRFKMRSVCFGVDEKIGTYVFNKDTLKLNYLSFREGNDSFKWGIIDTVKKNLNLYRNENDTVPYPLYIIKSEIQLE
jgi:hypothetical protein